MEVVRIVVVAMMTMAAGLVGRCSIGGGSVEFSHFQPSLQPVFALAGIEIRGSPMVHILWVFVPVPHKVTHLHRITSQFPRRNQP